MFLRVQRFKGQERNGRRQRRECLDGQSLANSCFQPVK